MAYSFDITDHLPRDFVAPHGTGIEPGHFRFVQVGAVGDDRDGCVGWRVTGLDAEGADAEYVIWTRAEAGAHGVPIDAAARAALTGGHIEDDALPVAMPLPHPFTKAARGTASVAEWVTAVMQADAAGHRARAGRMTAPMTDEVTHLGAMLRRLQHKKHELYVVSAFLHWLDDASIELTTQQAVRGPAGTYLLDLYFPQFRFGVEVDERHHEKQVELDAIRQKTILEVASVHIERVKVAELVTREAVDARIRELIELVRDRKRAALADGIFSPYVPGQSSDPAVWMRRGSLTVMDEAQFRRISDVCPMFAGVPYRIRRGWFRMDDGRELWFPALTPEGTATRAEHWRNVLRADGDIEEEAPDPGAPVKPHSDAERIVFVKRTDPVLGVGYRFAGIYRMSAAEPGRTTYSRVGDRVELTGALTVPEPA